MLHRVILESITTKSDLRAVVGGISNVLNIDKKSAVEKAKNLPLVLLEDCGSKEAKLMADMFSSMNASVRVEPPLEAEIARAPKPWVEPVAQHKGISLGALVFLIFILAGFAAFTAWKSDWIIEQLKPSPAKVEKSLQKGAMPEARRSISLQLRNKPNDYELLELLGRYYIGVARQKMNEERWKSYGEALSMPEIDSAITSFKTAEQVNPKNSDCVRWISIAQQMQRNFTDAEITARRAISIKSTNPDNWNQLGSVLVDLGKTGDAEQAFYNALKAEPNNSAALKNLTILNLYNTQDAERATSFLFAYMKKDEAKNDFDTYQIRMDLTTTMMKDFNPPWESIFPPRLPFDEYEKRRTSILANPNLREDPLLLEQLGMLYLSHGEETEAEAYFVDALRMNPKMESSRKMLALIQLRAERYDNALLTIQAATERGSREPFFWKNLGVLQKYYKMDIKQAAKAFNHYLMLGGDFYSLRVKKEF